MAQGMLRLKNNSFLVVGLLSTVLLVIQKSDGFEFKVGGSVGWKVPHDANDSFYNYWAEKNRFQIGDSLLFVYPADQDSVLHVTKEDYTNCTTSTPLEKFTDGHTVIKLNQSGPHYFISGVVEHCHKNEKLSVVVMADRNHHNNSNETVYSPPSPSPFPSPSPAPAGEESPSPSPPAGEITPTPPPSQESSPPPHKNDAASAVGTFNAAFVGLLVLVSAI